MNWIAVGNLLMSFVLLIVGIYDLRHGLIALGAFELWVSGGGFIAALHAGSRHRPPTPTERFIRQETQWPNFTWVKESPLLKPSERGKK